MKLLIITQAIDQNHSVLGFFCRWVEEFAKHAEQVTVICLFKGVYTLPKNVRVLSLGKERKESRLQYVLRFYRYIWRERNNYDSVFVHMNPEYICLGGLLWRILGKRIALWYTHKSVTLRLRLATIFSHVIFTASLESLRLKSGKVIVSGHGIDIQLFSPKKDKSQEEYSERYAVLSVGRISAVKNQQSMVRAFKILKERGFSGKLLIVGSAVTASDKEYEVRLKSYVNENGLSDTATFAGSVDHASVVLWYRKADMFINLSETGSLDKAVLEAMACGLQIITSNTAFKKMLGENNFTENDPLRIARDIEKLSKEEADPRWMSFVHENHSLTVLTKKLSEYIAKI